MHTEGLLLKRRLVGANVSEERICSFERFGNPEKSVAKGIKPLVRFPEKSVVRCRFHIHDFGILLSLYFHIITSNNICPTVHYMRAASVSSLNSIAIVALSVDCKISLDSSSAICALIDQQTF